MRELWPEYDWLWDKYIEGRSHVIPKSLLAECNKERVFTDSAYIPSLNKALKDYGRIPRVEAYYNGTPQVWKELKDMYV